MIQSQLLDSFCIMFKKCTIAAIGVFLTALGPIDYLQALTFLNGANVLAFTLSASWT